MLTIEVDVPSPDIPLTVCYDYVRGRKETAGPEAAEQPPSLLERSVVIGRPVVRRLDETLIDGKSERSILLAGGDRGLRYELILFACTLIAPDNLYLDDADLRLLLDGQGESLPTARSLLMEDVNPNGYHRTRQVKIGGGWALIPELTASQDKNIRSVDIQPLEEGTATPEWKMSWQESGVTNAMFHVELIVECEVADRVTGEIAMTLGFKGRRGGVFPYSLVWERPIDAEWLLVDP
jgi:hypothetical protein